MKTTSGKRIGFSGLLKSGKDHLADLLGLKKVSFAEPLYAVCEYVFGSCDKNNPRHRRFLQWIGQVGWGFKSESQCPDDLHRAAITILLRCYGDEIYPHPCWRDFGRRKDFWVLDLLRRVAEIEKHSGVNGVAVTNVRFRHELAPLKAAGFEHYLVLCSEETRRSRYWSGTEWEGHKYMMIPEEIDRDVSEVMARELVHEMPDDHIIWNDTVKMPVGRQYLTVEKFVEKFNACAKA